MIRVKTNKPHFFDLWILLTSNRYQAINEVSPLLFPEHLPGKFQAKQKIPFSLKDSNHLTRELHTVLKAIFFQQSMNLEVLDTIEQFSCNIQRHYTLDLFKQTTRPNKSAKKICRDLYKMPTNRWYPKTIGGSHKSRGCKFQVRET